MLDSPELLYSSPGLMRMRTVRVSTSSTATTT